MSKSNSFVEYVGAGVLILTIIAVVAFLVHIIFMPFMLAGTNYFTAMFKWKPITAFQLWGVIFFIVMTRNSKIINNNNNNSK